MEENQDMLHGEEPNAPLRESDVPDEGDVQQDAAQGASAQTPLHTATCDASEAQALADEAQERADEVDDTPVAPPLAWEFEKAQTATGKKEKSTGKWTFFAVFGGALLVCLALLIALLFLGDGGFRIIKALHSERTVFVREDDGTSGLLTPQEAADAVRKYTVTVVAMLESGATATGSGFVYDDKGHICTNHHVIEDATRVQIVLPGGEARDASVLAYDALSDLAVLSTDPTGLVPATIGSSDALLTGDSVVAVGTPLSLDFAGTATFGKISYTRRLLPVDDTGDGVYEKKLWVIQTDAGVNPGNSGGPMADMYGRVVGIVVRKMLGSESLGFAIPIDGARVILNDLIAKGSFTGQNPVAEGRSLLGITGHAGKAGMWYLVDPLTNEVRSSTEEQAGYHHMPVDGVYVTDIESVGAKGKVFAGDVIVAVNGLAVYGTQDLIAAVNRFVSGETVTLSIWRNGASISVTVPLYEG